jgi:uncharacterized protein
MCGGLVSSVVRKGRDSVQYHLGRLLGYCSLGALAGFLGRGILQGWVSTWIPELATFLISMGFVWMGVSVWRGRSVHLYRLPTRFLVWLNQMFKYGAFSTGFLSALLPCGWLHTFVLGAVATQDPGMGALYLLFFWLGTLPALHLMPLAARKLMSPWIKTAPRLSGFVLVCFGLMTLGMKWIPQLSGKPSCHYTAK